MSATTSTGASTEVQLSEPRIARFLFTDKRSAPLWLALRVWIGVQWFAAGMEKAFPGLLEGDLQMKNSWLNNGGASLKAYWQGSLAVAPGAKGAKITYDWYWDFLNMLVSGQHYTWFSWFIALGETAVGLGLIFGCLTAIAAFFGTLMNFSFMLAGSTSTNPALFAITIFIVLGWKTAGFWGLDYYVLPLLGTPWERGKVTGGKKNYSTPSPVA